MATSTTLDVTGYSGEPVPNRLLRPQGAIDRLAVLLPGIAYTLDMPLFYYAQHLLIEQGWDVLRVEYAYSERNAYRSLSDEERARWLFADATAAYRAGIVQRAYQEIMLIGKSLGTLAMGHLLTAERPTLPTRGIWLTPLIGLPVLREQIAEFGGRSLFVIGTADSHYDSEVFKSLCDATHGESVVIDGADHGMDIQGDPVASVRAMERVVEAMARFV
jgi:hypothetical protein